MTNISPTNTTVKGKESTPGPNACSRHLTMAAKLVLKRQKYYFVLVAFLLMNSILPELCSDGYLPDTWR